jgi:ascorbate-specific PTS system EIIC-type component UlaA
MSDRPHDESDETISFPGGWKGLYIFLVIYGFLQIVILYWFTATFNRP